MAAPRHDRIIPLGDLNAYPGTDFLDRVLFLPHEPHAQRRIWLLTPRSNPALGFDDLWLSPKRTAAGTPRWLDYGTVDLPIPPRGFMQLRVRDLPAQECAASFLLISSRPDFNAEQQSLADAERALLGLARSDAGSTTLSPARVVSGTPTRFTVRYTAGPQGLPAGARICFTVPAAFALPQDKDPQANGYLSVLRGDTPVRIVEIAPSSEMHQHRDIFCCLDASLAAGEGFGLSYRSDYTFIFAMTQNLVQSDRQYWYTRLPVLSAAVALAEGKPLVCQLENHGHAVDFTPGPAARLNLLLPGRRRASERLALRGVYTDQFRNVAPSGPIDTKVELVLERDGEQIPLGGAAGKFTTRHRFEIPLPTLKPGVYRALAFRSGTREVLARSNPLQIIADDSKLDRIYWGEIHGHTSMSDGGGEYAELYRYARDEGALDFAAAADHACYHSDNQWLVMQDTTNSFNQPDRFVTLVGYEWAGQQVHRNVYTSRDRLQLFRGMYPPTSTLDVVWKHFHGDAEVVGGPHATLAHGMRKWEHHDPDVQRFVEIYSCWGANDHRGNPWANPLRAKDSALLGAHDLLLQGAKLGFTGGGDCHEGRVGFGCENPDAQGKVPHVFADALLFHCGMTAAVMPALGRSDLIRALRERCTYATTGPRILLDFSAADLPMGQSGKADTVTCRAQVHAVAPIRALEIIKDGTVAFTQTCGKLDASLDWTDPARPGREHFYYLRVTQEDGEMAWSSPVWVSR